MTNYKLKTISITEKNLLDRELSKLVCCDERSITEEYKDFFFDELLFDLARPWPLGIKDCKFYIGNGTDEERKR